MRLSDIGIGLGALTHNLAGGLLVGRGIKDARNRNELERISREGLEQAGAQREQDITQIIQDMGATNEGGSIMAYDPDKGRFVADPETRKRAESLVGSQNDYFMQHTAPQIRDTYLAQGNLEMAKEWDEHVKSDKGRRAINDWMKSWTALNAGDVDGGIKGFANYMSEYIDPSLQYVSHAAVEGQPGQFNVTFKNRKTGKEIVTPIDEQSVFRLGAAYNPQTLFNMEYNERLSASKARAKDAGDERKFNREQMGRERIEILKDQLKRQYGAAGDGLAENYRKGMSPNDMVFNYIRDQSQNDHTFRRLSPDQQLEQAEQVVRGVFERGSRILQPTGPDGGIQIRDTQPGQPLPADLQRIMQLPQEAPGQAAPAPASAEAERPPRAAQPSQQPAMANVATLVDEIEGAEETLRSIQSGQLMNLPPGAARESEQRLSAARSRLEAQAAEMGTTPEQLVADVERQRQAQRAQRDLAGVEKQLADQQRLLARLEGASDLRSRERAAFLRRNVASLQQRQAQLAAIVRSPGPELSSR